MRGGERLGVGWAAVAALALPWAIVRCNTDHEQLAERPGSGGATGSTSSSGLTSNAATSVTGTQSSTSTGSGGSISYTPDGDDVLTLVHGQVDAEHIAFCLGRADEGRTRFDAPPIPRGGLGYGDSFTLSEAEDLDFEHDAIELVVLTGEFDEDADCEDTLGRAYWPGRVQGPGSGAGGAAGAGGASDAGIAGAAGAEAVPRPALRAMVMPSIPANSLVLGRHYVMVFAGCMGGPGVVDESGLHCGANHSNETPSLRPLLVPASRAVDPARLSLQFLHASTATSQVDVQSVPANGSPGVQAYLTSRVRFGVIAPQEPALSHSSETLGLPQGAEFVVYSPSGGEFRAQWTKLPGVTEIADGHSYLSILLGPRLGTDAAEGFNPSSVTLLPTDLGREE